MKTPADLTFEPLVVRRWAYRAAWLMLAVIEVLFIVSAWVDPPLEQRFSWTALLLCVPAALLVVGGAWVRMDDEGNSRWDYKDRVEARRPLCIAVASFFLLSVFVLMLTSLWVNSHAGDLAQTAAALVPVPIVFLLMSVNWEDF